jgi:ABC-type multidrug transport system fused ATPase/permease subunit
MGAGRNDDAPILKGKLLFVVFLIVLFFVLGKIAILSRLALFVVFFVLLIIHVFGNDVQMHGMDLRDFQFRLALRATENLAFFDLVFVDVDFSGTFRAADHGSILRRCVNSRPR